MLQAIKFNAENGTLEVLDQLLLPHLMKYIKINSVEDGWNAINKMQVWLWSVKMCYCVFCGCDVVQP
jgi:methylthioribose-1-phosphate isomerase